MQITPVPGGSQRGGEEEDVTPGQPRQDAAERQRAATPDSCDRTPAAAAVVGRQLVAEKEEWSWWWSQ
ncbi:hypothetical protein NDU88_007050 [Pleurodeles waltl]|uniref:Uncharacterized protein n=1 Tax=Pleurodeles waltl TaxID=8319 RepID=A0AAV7NWW2_PLEWA|nr:hypothetical protein NDU88_007050 [Pleurodeles waltl]